MAQWGKALATKPGDMNATRRTHIGGRREMTPTSCPLTYIHTTHTHTEGSADKTELGVLGVAQASAPSIWEAEAGRPQVWG